MNCCACSGLLAGLEHAAAGQADERAGILVLEVVQRRIAAALFGFGLIAEPVVVVDDAAVDLAGVDGLHGGDVVVVDLRVGLHAGQPLRGGLLALQLQQGGDDGLEVRLGRRCAPAALPRGLLQIQHGFRQLVGLQPGLVVDEDGAARRDTGPLAGGRTVLRRNLIDGVGVEVGEQVRPSRRRPWRGSSRSGRRRRVMRRPRRPVDCPARCRRPGGRSP